MREDAGGKMGIWKQRKWVEDALLAGHGEDANEGQAPLGGGSHLTSAFSRIIGREE